MKLIFYITFLLSSTFCNAQNWEEVPNQLNTDVKCLFADSVDNLLYMTGIFGLNGTDTVRGAATWDNFNISGLAEGIMNFSGGSTSGVPLYDVVRFQDKIYMGGGATNFTVGDSIWTRSIGIWDGVAWDSCAFGLVDQWGFTAGITAMNVINGELYVAGDFTFIESDQLAIKSLAKFNGTTWSSVFDFPTWNGESNVYEIVEFNNEIYLSGVLLDNYPYDTIYNICRYNGSEWETLGDGIGGAFSSVDKMLEYNGKLYVCGSFNKNDRPLNPGNRIAAWNGSSWEQVADIFGSSPTSNARVYDMCVFNNELYLVGDFKEINGQTTSNVAKFDGTDWCVYDDVFDLYIQQIELYDSELYISGIFENINSTSVLRVAKLLPTATPVNCESVVNIDKIDNVGFGLYPNPVIDELTIEINTSGFGKIIISEINGSYICGYIIQDGNLTIDLSFLETGVYLISDEQGQTNRIIKL